MVATNNSDVVEEPQPSVGASVQAESVQIEDIPEESKEEKTERAKTLLQEGKRALLVGTYAEATEKLGESCALYSSLFDQFSAECYEPHFCYGKSLLELARMEPDVFTNAMQGAEGVLDESMEDEEEEAKNGDVPDEKEKTDEQFGDDNDLTEAEREEVREQVEDALEENAEALDNGHLPPDDPSVNEHEKEDEQKEDEQKDDEEEDDKEENEEKDGEEAIADEEGVTEQENVPHLQLAWEVLEIARSICDKQDKSNDWQEKKVAVLLVLGEVSIEDENYKQALDDLQLCLTILKELYPSETDRRVAETLFQMGRACTLSEEFETAAEYYQRAHDTIKARADEMQQKLATVGEDAEEKSRLETEMKDLLGLLPDILSKVEDARESSKMVKEAKTVQAGEGEQQSALDSTDMAAAKPLPSDISSLVRKPVKRGGDTIEEKSEDAKRTKDSDETPQNGHSVQDQGADEETEDKVVASEA